jgi:hypothetical protein
MMVNIIVLRLVTTADARYLQVVYNLFLLIIWTTEIKNVLLTDGIVFSILR